MECDSRIGSSKYGPTGKFLDALVDDVRIYNRTLSEDEIKALYLQRAESHNSFVSQKDVTVDSNGNVGIGTVLPGRPLHIYNPTRNTVRFETDNIGNIAGIEFYKNGTRYGFVYDHTDYLSIIRETGGIEFKTGAGTSEATRMTITDNGEIGIGTSNPSEKLTIYNGNLLLNKSVDNSPVLKFIGGGGENARIFVQDDGDYLDISKNGTTAIAIKNGGNVGIGTTSPSTKLHVAGTVTEDSDMRLKQNITQIANSLQKLQSIRGIEYRWKNKTRYNNETNIGLIAQDVEQVFPQAVFEDENGYKSVSYSKMVAPLIEAVKEQQKEIEQLKKQVKSLQSNN